MPEASEKTKVFTYRVDMIIQVLAKDLQTAANSLNTNGGYITSRSVELLNTTDIIVEKPLK